MFLRYLAQILALAAACLPLSSGGVFVAGVLVMVTALGIHVLFEWVSPSDEAGGTNTRQLDSLTSATATRQPDLAFTFVFTTGALLTCAEPAYSLAAFMVMFITWQIVRGRDRIHGPAEFLPDPFGFAASLGSQIAGLFKRKQKLSYPRNAKSWLPWFMPVVSVVILIVRKVA